MPGGDSQMQRNAQARRAALAAVAGRAREPSASIAFSSQGRLLLIGGAAAPTVATRIAPPLQARVLLTDDTETAGMPALRQGGRTMRLHGHLGAFRIALGEPGAPGAETLTADLVLDLGPAPQLAMPVPPLGYAHCAPEEPALGRAIAVLVQLVGDFEKPKFFEYDAARCAHGRNGRIACTQCLDACPTQAIRSLADRIAVDPNLCQGGGICAAVCPGGAIRYDYPSPKDTLAQIRTLLRTYAEHSGAAPVLALFAESDGEVPSTLTANVLPMVIEELASVGLDVWLSALAYGAQALWLVDGGGLPASVRPALEAQLQTAQTILAALGHAPQALRLLSHAELAALAEQAPAALRLAQTANFSAHNDKRETAYIAIEHLQAQAARPPDQTPLPAGAPFGEIQVDTRRCTLCMACVGACPANALRAGEGAPQLSFLEANCLQCGLCALTCPETAITLQPRMLFQRAERSQWRVLHAEAPLPCAACGKPFATRSAIDRVLAKLQHHAMFQGARARRRLLLCEDCRVADVAQDREMMAIGLGGQAHEWRQ